MEDAQGSQRRPKYEQFDQEQADVKALERRVLRQPLNQVRIASPICGAKVQRIRYANNETNYCPGCQTDGKLLADRSLSLLLKKDWPKTPEELEERLHG